MILDLRLLNAHPVQFPIDVFPTKRQRFRGCSKPTVATQAQDHLPDRICFLHQFVDHFARYELVDFDGASLRSNLRKRILIDDLPIDRIVHELPCELDPFVDRRRGHPSGFELLEDADNFIFRLRANRMFEWVLSMSGEATIRLWKRYTLKQP